MLTLSAMNANNRDIKFLIVSALTWGLLAFAVLKLVVIYSATPSRTYVFTYYMTCILFVLFSYGYFRRPDRVLWTVMTTTVFCLTIQAYEVFYGQLILIWPKETPAEFVAMLVGSSIVVSLVLIGLIIIIKRILSV